ncbi:MAG: TIGR03619 family F420-dependent LLM class oxidoreductase [Betaproteobacteria bacterium]|nr:TIGR03619 family F420-dependent LLM class oxidoreductase [Betaproteobacteria bacterium]
MEFGIKLANCERLPLAEGVGTMAAVAEKFGYDSVWVADHVVIPSDLTMDAAHAANNEFLHKQNADALMSLAYVAGMTRRVRLGTSVMVLPLRNPLLAAKMLATLDDLSGGRAILGAGIGWMAEEFGRLQAPAFNKRGKVADEWIRIMRTCWTARRPEFAGEHYAFGPIHFSPQPKQPIPIWVGGNSEAALRRAGRLGDGWLGTRVGAAEIAPALAHIRAAAEAAGRDPAKLTIAVGLEADILAPGTAKPTAGLFAPPEKGLIGTVGEITDRVGTLQEVGVHCIELRFRTARDAKITTIAPTLEAMQCFAEDVMKGFRKG